MPCCLWQLPATVHRKSKARRFCPAARPEARESPGETGASIPYVAGAAGAVDSSQQRLLVVANRLPVSAYRDKAGRWQFEVNCRGQCGSNSICSLHIALADIRALHTNHSRLLGCTPATAVAHASSAIVVLSTRRFELHWGLRFPNLQSGPLCRSAQAGWCQHSWACTTSVPNGLGGQVCV